MPMIGSNPGIGSGSQLEIGALRAVSSADLHPILAPRVAVPAAPVAAGIVTSTSLNAGPTPVDRERVATIKKAITTHSYPLIPARIGDAMIAAGMILRMPK
jgi:negative regulator of flagellin synthesis FlgM